MLQFFYTRDYDEEFEGADCDALMINVLVHTIADKVRKTRSSHLVKQSC